MRGVLWTTITPLTGFLLHTIPSPYGERPISQPLSPQARAHGDNNLSLFPGNDPAIVHVLAHWHPAVAADRHDFRAIEFDLAP